MNDAERRKFGLHTKHVCIVGYAALGGYAAIDMYAYANHRKVKLIYSRHILCDRYRFPLRSIHSVGLFEHFLQSVGATPTNMCLG